jgi:hypothetical protein
MSNHSLDEIAGDRVELHIMHCKAPRAGWGQGEYDSSLDESIEYTPEGIAFAVIENKRKQAFHLAKQSVIPEGSDTLEGRVLQGDWDHARTLAPQRLDQFYSSEATSPKPTPLLPYSSPAKNLLFFPKN